VNIALAVILFIVGTVLALGTVRYLLGFNRVASYSSTYYWPTIVIGGGLAAASFWGAIALL